MASDNFNRANETPLAVPWTKNGGNNFNLASNAITQTSSADTYYYYAGAASTANHYSEASEASTIPGHDWGPAVRIGGAAHPTVAEGYAFDAYQWANGTAGIVKHVNGAFTQVSIIDTTGYALNDVLRMEANGTTLRALRNGVQVGTATDASLTTGQPGIFIYEATGTVDNWAGGDLGAPFIVQKRRLAGQSVQRAAVR